MALSWGVEVRPRTGVHLSGAQFSSPRRAGCRRFAPSH
nr:J295 [uncultured bacterium]